MTRNVTVAAGEVAGLAAGEFVQMSVTDTGEGMSSETQARAFDPFFTTKDTGKGTGLGLSQIYGFAHQLGGTAQIKSAVGVGTTVTIWLPQAQIVPASSEPSAVAESVPLASLRILLVDDDQTVRALIGEMLGDLGHEVTDVDNGPAALAQLSNKTAFDLLLVDFAMPVMNGAEVAAEAMRLRPHLPVLFMTGYADTSVLNSWTQLGHRTLNKPFGATDVDLAIRQTIGSRRNVVQLMRAR
jgi:CheY-like chemotaxis protein